jgi:hypothetical protein
MNTERQFIIGDSKDERKKAKLGYANKFFKNQLVVFIISYLIGYVFTLFFPLEEKVFDDGGIFDIIMKQVVTVSAGLIIYGVVIMLGSLIYLMVSEFKDNKCQK